MIEFKKYPTVVTGNADLPLLTRSEDAQAFATFPNFANVVHPEYLANGNLSAINRATGQLNTTGNTTNQIIRGAFPNGSVAFDMLATLAGQPEGVGLTMSQLPTGASAAEWSVAFVVQKEGVAAATLGAAVSQNANTGHPRLLWTTGQRLAIANGTAFVVQDTLQANPVATKYVATYSSARGAKIFRDDVLVASSAAGFDVPSAVINRLFSFNPNSVMGLTKFLLSAGYHMTLDLSRPEHSAKMAALSKYLHAKYIA